MSTILEEQINLRRIEGTDNYTASWHEDWTVGPALHGGGIAAIIQLTAATHLRSDPHRFRNQKHLINLHMDLLNACERCESTITVVPLKVGASANTLQLQLFQKDKIRVVALATSTNFDQPLGPSVPNVWAGLAPPPKPKPDFDRVLAGKPDDNWVPCILRGEVIPMTARILGLYPRGGFVAPGICDSWHGFLGDGDRVDETYVAWMSDFIPSMSDTLLRNGGLFDAHVFRDKAEVWARDHPGVTCPTTNTLAEAVKSAIWNNTLTIDIEYKRALPKEGLRFVFIRTAANMFDGGRLQIEITICNEDMELVATVQQSILVLEASRKFVDRKKKPARI